MAKYKDKKFVPEFNQQLDKIAFNDMFIMSAKQICVKPVLQIPAYLLQLFINPLFDLNYVSKEDNEGTILHLVANNCLNPLAELFVRNGANLLLADKDGNTPLQCSIIAGKLDVAEYFLERMVELKFHLNSTNNEALTAVQLCEKLGCLDLAEKVRKLEESVLKKASSPSMEHVERVTVKTVVAGEEETNWEDLPENNVPKPSRPSRPPPKVSTPSTNSKDSPLESSDSTSPPTPQNERREASFPSKPSTRPPALPPKPQYLRKPSKTGMTSPNTLRNRSRTTMFEPEALSNPPGSKESEEQRAWTADDVLDMKAPLKSPSKADKKLNSSPAFKMAKSPLRKDDSFDLSAFDVIAQRKKKKGEEFSTESDNSPAASNAEEGVEFSPFTSNFGFDSPHKKTPSKSKPLPTPAQELSEQENEDNDFYEAEN